MQRKKVKVGKLKVSKETVVLCRSKWKNGGLCVGLYGESEATLIVGT